jgi:DNA-directed RNA polymerase subunit E'/Rpb7
MLKAKLIERCIPELGLIVTVNSFQVVGKLIVQPQSQALKVFKHFIITFQEENSRVTRIVISNDKNISLASHRANPRGTDNIHME